MTEDLHVRLSDADVRVLNELVKRRSFATISEAVRFGVKQLIQTQRFASIVAPTLTETQKRALAGPLATAPLKSVEDLMAAAMEARPTGSSPLKRAFTSLEALRENLERERELLALAREALSQLEEGQVDTRETLPDRRQPAGR